ncbi:MAG: hypothetical protein QXV17_04375 [Candidatus Micrarchaeaceae archaeon]
MNFDRQTVKALSLLFIAFMMTLAGLLSDWMMLKNSFGLIYKGHLISYALPLEIGAISVLAYVFIMYKKYLLAVLFIIAMASGFIWETYNQPLVHDFFQGVMR